MDGEILRLEAPAPPASYPGAESVAFYRDHRLSLVRLAVLLAGDPETAEDVVQDVFARLHGTWRPGVMTLAYVRTCVLNPTRSGRGRVRWIPGHDYGDPPSACSCPAAAA
ncbi:sigma factor [Streptosporangium sp. DT93]|uniref:sigma factor n=1 Tax=Streptosporangium sp. DT93 TaxID=3393428 RepID=UPI003CF808E8